ncbi:phospholipid carrier-dependent glycosyltransferase [Nonomuraea sp. MG754425]|uniref:ArnT family glycosyltransferase n=1 Tax=Nonomuraea sp. MG754425 TaxID=2570319 RepID=UPI0023517E1B|nr:glycosyltransferase family 39 protein [Nonomuraea sp. MG754425]MCF6475304.1 phospholipid carrier-dependent glycosyltransferase [Nonomuraea sp. MG754425]
MTASARHARTLPDPSGRSASNRNQGGHRAVWGRLRRLALGGPEDPRWSRPALWGVLLAAFVLYAWSLSSAGHANSYYSAAVKSGTESWKAFFFGSLDSESFITVDKPPMALWVMGLFARVLGFGTWSLLLPQALAGVAAVAVLHATVRRAAGLPAALIAAGVLALTPITVAINRENAPDPLLVLFLVLAGWACQRAIETGRLRLLLASAVFVGCGFTTKMLQAFVVVPALVLVYLMAARPDVPRRIRHLLAAGAALAASSSWWMVVVDLIPSGSRPFIGGSTDGTVWDVVIGFNGLGRIFGEGGGSGGGGLGAGSGGFGGAAGAGRLFNDIVGGQISWLLPFAVLALVTGLVLLRKRPRTDLARAALVLWGGWLAVHYAVFSFAGGVFHPYYTTALAPAIAALTGSGGVLLYGAYRRSVRWSWVLPVGVVATGAWSFVLLNRTAEWNPWLPWVVAAATVAAVPALVAARLPWRRGRGIAVASVAFTLVAALAGPGAYASATAFGGTDHSYGNALAGPSTEQRPNGQGPGARQPGGQGQAQAGGGGVRVVGGPAAELSPELIGYLRRNRGDARWLVAVSAAQQAAGIILSTGEPVIAMGGFTGQDPAMTVAKLQDSIKNGELRHILLDASDRGPAGPRKGVISAVAEWVRQHGTLIDAGEYGGSGGPSKGAGQQLYRLG